jgi:hypothetical protein
MNVHEERVWKLLVALGACARSGEERTCKRD